MRKFLTAASLAAIMGGSAFVAVAFSQTPAVPAYAAAAIADPARPAADTARDSIREPAAMLAFSGVKPGSLVAEWIPGGGYFTRIFAKTVGSNGHVYAIASAGRGATTVQGIAAEPTYGSTITVIAGDLGAAKTPQLVDVAWTSQNYHDLTNEVRAAVNKATFDMLKPGGIYIVLDHSGIIGSDTTGLHRVDEELVKTQVKAAGFEYVGENNILRRPDDDRTKAAADASLGHDTDQFIFKFRKPG